MENENNKKGWLNKKTIIGGIVGLLVIVLLVANCGGGDSTKQENENRKMEASTLKLKGKDAGLFKVDGDYELKLVKVEYNWEVRAKATISKAKDFDASEFESHLRSGNIEFLDGDDAELMSEFVSTSDLDELLTKEVGESEEITFKIAFEIKRMDYERAKRIFDNTRKVVITGIELAPIKTETSQSHSSSYDDDDDDVDMDKALDQAQKMLDAEKDMLKAAKGLSNDEDLEKAQKLLDAETEMIKALGDM